MVYAQIKDGIVVNCVILEDETLIDLFTEGFDYLININDLDPIPSIDWTYDSGNNTFSEPVPIPVFRISNSFESPENLDYDILGLHKKRSIIGGELRTIEYYKNYDGTTYSDLSVLETRTYTRNEIGLVTTRNLEIKWYLSDDSIGYSKSYIKYYSPIEAIDEGISMRSNVIGAAKIYSLNSLGTTYSFDLLNSVKTQVDLFVQGYKQPLIDGINNSTKAYLTQEIKDGIVTILTF